MKGKEKLGLKIPFYFPYNFHIHMTYIDRNKQKHSNIGSIMEIGAPKPDNICDTPYQN